METKINTADGIKKAGPHGTGNQIQNKDTSRLTELQTILQYLKNHVATASMVSDATGVKQKNICRYKRDLEKAEMLWEVERKSCIVTGFKAWYLTTNPDNAPNGSVQLKLWRIGHV